MRQSRLPSLTLGAFGGLDSPAPLPECCRYKVGSGHSGRRCQVADQGICCVPRGGFLGSGYLMPGTQG